MSAKVQREDTCGRDQMRQDREVALERVRDPVEEHDGRPGVAVLHVVDVDVSERDRSFDHRAASAWSRATIISARRWRERRPRGRMLILWTGSACSQ